jgi:hypothetical protein
VTIDNHPPPPITTQQQPWPEQSKQPANALEAKLRDTN